MAQYHQYIRWRGEVFLFALIAFTRVSCTSGPSFRCGGMAKRGGWIPPKGATVAILPFTNKSPYRHRMSGATADLFEAKLFQSGFGIRFVERRQINIIVQEQGIEHSALFDENTAVRLGKLIGARFVIMGKVVEAGEDLPHGIDLLFYQRKCQQAEVSVVVRIVDVERGTVVWAGGATATGERASAAVLGLGTVFTYDERLLDLSLQKAIDELISMLIQGNI